jgi:hypothetical protein
MNAKILPLDARAIRYLRSEMEATNQIGRAVLASIVLEDGSIVAVVPERHSPNMYDFRSSIFPRGERGRSAVSGGYVETVPSTEGAVSAWVSGVLQLDARRAIVCESYLLRAADLERAARLPRRTVASGDFVYHWAAHVDSEDDVASVVRMAYPVPLGFAVICTFPVDPIELLGGATIDPSVLATIARSTDCVLLGAYDGESVLVWTRRGAPFQVSGVNLN